MVLMKKLFLLLSIIAFVSCGKETTTKKVPAREKFKDALSSLVVGQSTNMKYTGQDRHYDYGRRSISVYDINEDTLSIVLKIEGSKVMVINAHRRKFHPTHFNLQQALFLLDELKIGQGYLIHLSHQMGKHEVVSSELPEQRFVAYDGLQIIID
jgi:hypothetical protein